MTYKEGTSLKADVDSKIKSVSTPKKLPDGTSYQSISNEQTLSLANLFSIGEQHIEIATLESSEVLKIPLNKGSVLRNKLLFVDLMDNTIEVLDLIEPIFITDLICCKLL